MGFPPILREDLARFLKDCEKYQETQKQDKKGETFFGQPFWKGVCLSGQATGLDLAELLKGAGESFHEMLFRLIDESGMTDAQCYKKANIDRKLFSKIRSDKFYKSSKTTVLAFALALELPLSEMQDMLQKAGFALSHSSKFDII